MSRFRFTNDELINSDSKDHLSDYALILALINERKSNVTNVYAPLSIRLKQLGNRVEKCIENNIVLENNKFDKK